MSSEANVISFYSFKGGTGRSTSLANVAYALAEQGANVACMDLDLAAPGLHMIFPWVGRVHAQTGTIHEYLSGNGEIRDIEKYVIEVGKQIGERPRHEEPDGNIQLIAGDVEPPGQKPPREMMNSALELKDAMMKQYDLDYMLLDSRSGLSAHMLQVFDRADEFLAFHRWTPQHKTGTIKLAEWLDRVPSPDSMMSIASNVPNIVKDQDVEDWLYEHMTIYGFDEYHVINTSDILKGGEEVVTLTEPESAVAEQYRSLAERLGQ